MKLLVPILSMIIGSSYAMMQESDGWLKRSLARNGWDIHSASIRSHRRLKKDRSSSGKSSKSDKNDVVVQAAATNNSSLVVAVDDGQSSSGKTGKSKGKKKKGKGKKGKEEDLVVDYTSTMAPVEAPVYEPTAVPSQHSEAPTTTPKMDESPTVVDELSNGITSTPTVETETESAQTEATPNVDAEVEPTLAEDIYKVYSCGNESLKSLVSMEVSYLYMIRVVQTYDVQYAVDSVHSIEERTLKSVAEGLLSCDNAFGSGRRLTAYGGVSAAPEDKPNGLCGEFCTVVKGGMTVYTEDEGASDMTEVQCTVLAIIRDSMLQIESRDDGIDKISFIGDSEFDCLSDAGSVSGLSRPEDPNRNQQGKVSVVVQIALGVATGVAFMIAVAFLAVMKRRFTRPRSVAMYAKETDSVMTPDTGGDTQGMNGSPEMSIYDSPERVSENINAVKPTGLAASILGFCDYQTNQHIVGRDDNGDFVYDNGDFVYDTGVDYNNTNHAADDVADSLVRLEPLISPMTQDQDREPRNRRKKSGIVVSPGADPRTNRKLFLDAISEDNDDDHDDVDEDDLSVETAEASNT